MKTTMRAALLAALGGVAVVQAGCGGDGEDLPTSNGLFSYEPGPPGASPGWRVRAVLEDDTDLESNELEVRLYDRDEERAAAREALAPQRVQVSGELMGSLLDGAGGGGGDAGEALRIATRQALSSPDGGLDLRHARRALGPDIDLGGQEVEPRGAVRRWQRPAQAQFDVRIPVMTAGAGGSALNDVDGDGIPVDPDLPTCSGGVTTGCSDNCPLVYNPDQRDSDLNGVGDACEGDRDGDGVPDEDDNCPDAYNPRQWDTDGDGLGDACDPDSNGSGTPDIEELDVDHDGDGIPTGQELGDGATPRDSDGDGVPDYLDPDDDGDGIPTRREVRNNDRDPASTDPLRDTDGDGVPDYLDPDSDGDGVPDGSEGFRDTDGDGVPDYRDQDDDGDGKPTRDEISMDDQDVDGDGIPNHLDEDDEDGCNERAVGRIYPDIPTFGGVTMWMGTTFTVTNLFDSGCTDPNSPFGACPDKHYTWMLHFAPDGVYFTLQYAEGVSVSDTFAGIGVADNFGILFSPDGDGSMISGETLSSGRAISLSQSIGSLLSVTYGISMFEQVPPGFPFLKTGVQLDTGLSVSLGLFDFFFGLSFFPDAGLSLSSGGITIRTADGRPGFLMVGGYAGPCPESGRRVLQSAAGDRGGDRIDALGSRFTAARNDSSATPGADYRRSLGASGAALTDLLGERTGYGTAQNVPAPSSGDWIAEFAGGDGEACTNCVNMSLAGTIQRTSAAIRASGGSGGQVRDLMRVHMGELQTAWTDREQMASRMNVAAGGIVNAGQAWAFDVLAVRRGDAFRFIADEVVEVDATIGEPASFTVTAAEIAALTGFDEAELEGATICVENSPRIDRVCGALEDGALTGTVTPDGPEPMILLVEVDLTTAVGRLDDEAVERWVVRPANRVFRVRPGSPEQVALTGMGQTRSGTPLVFNATLLDGRGFPTAERARFELIDPSGEVVASTTTTTGTAALQTVPTPVTPVVTSVEAQTVSVGGEDVPGYVIRGTGFSRDATIRINGQTLQQRGWLYTVGSSSAIGVAVTEGSPLAAGQHSVTLTNPGNRGSGTVSFTVP